MYIHICTYLHASYLCCMQSIYIEYQETLNRLCGKSLFHSCVSFFLAHICVHIYSAVMIHACVVLFAFSTRVIAREYWHAMASYRIASYGT